MNEPDALEPDPYEGFVDTRSAEAIHYSNMDRHAERLYKTMHSAFLLQIERRDADRIQIVEIRKELTGLRRDLNWLLLVVVILAGYIIYKY